MVSSVLVLGGTGTLGVPVVRSLVDRGRRVRVLARSAAKARGLLGSEVDVVEGESTNREHLGAALTGCDGVHISLPMEAELTAVKNIVKLADTGLAGDLERVSYISGTSVRQENRWFEVIDVKMRAEELLGDSGIPHTVFCPTWVMEVLPNFVRPGRAVVIKGRKPPAFHFFAGSDLGRMVANAYEDDRALGRRLFIHGPEAFTLQEAIEAYHQAWGRRARLGSLKPWQARFLARLTGNPSLGSVARLIAYFDTTAEHGDPSEANDLLGKPETTLDQWIREAAHMGPGA